ncbi:MAG: peptide chain release factor-like protein [Spirochaetes bacterium]|nr:MAG: peptide chain release factor-like protein [Spirochaetota bacterium]
MPRTKQPTPDAAALLAECAVDYYSGTGKGGQNRNRHYNCVRLHHLPSGLIALGTEHRSQAKNREDALMRLSEKLEALNYTPPPRKPTKVPRGAVKERLDSKTRKGVKKTVRKRVTNDEGAD